MKEKAHRESGGIGGQAQDVEVHVGVQVGSVKLHSGALTQVFDHCGQICHTVGGWLVESEHGKHVLIGALAVLGPEDNGGIAHALDMFPISQEVIEGGSIGKRCIFSHWGVVVLFLPIGTEGGGVK